MRKKYNITPEGRAARAAPWTCPNCLRTMGRSGKGPHSLTCGKESDAFWAKVNKDGPNGCWVWTASRKPNGYAQFYFQGRMYRAHRRGWALSGRELPAPGLSLAHTCDNRICVNPDHLFVATHQENMDDMQRKGRAGARGETCIHAKLTEDQVRAIRLEFRRDGHRKTNAAELALKYGVSPGHIQSVCYRGAWSHVK